MVRRIISAFALLAVFCGAASVRADEIRLKDGTKITGTIVGFENGAFRVETSYGFALIEKDKVADINITASKKEPEPKAKASTPAPPPATPAVVPAVAKESSAPGKNANKPEIRATGSTCPEGTICDGGIPHGEQAPHPDVSTVSVEPPIIRDEIHGNVYANLTYGFQMYKPPSWDLIPAARKALPDAVAALGTDDQTTLLVIGMATAKDSLDAQSAATGKALSGVYDNYRLISSRHLTVAGLPAVEQRSRGTADGRDWSVILVTLLRGKNAFTLLGMTWADSDLIQVQENVIAKAVNSLTFQ